ncbi:MAG: hypothetical protein NVS4B8_13300 [Herpetosiphon sp.]
MNDTTYAIVFAMIGWLASSIAVKTSRISSRVQRILIIPLWFVWLALALGGPVVNGRASVTEALASGAACTAGLITFLLVSALRTRRSSR